MAIRKSGLGKGLDSLIPFNDSKFLKKNGQLRCDTVEKFVNISTIEPDLSQPRQEFDEVSIYELSESIKRHGIIQPIIVKRKNQNNSYQIISGERRWKAAKIAGLEEVPVIVRDYSELETIEVSIVENIQRENLNPIEEALSYKRLIDEFNFTQEDIANSVSKSRVSIANTLRLLNLDDRVKDMLIKGLITAGHAKVLLQLKNGEKQLNIAQLILAKNLSVRETEKCLNNNFHSIGTKTKKENKMKIKNNVFYNTMEEKMKTILGSKVSINQKTKTSGKIVIDYCSKSDFNFICNTILSIKR